MNSDYNDKQKIDSNKVILYAEHNHGKEISESELRKIVSDLEQRGFSGYYERIGKHSLLQTLIELFKKSNVGET